MTLLYLAVVVVCCFGIWKVSDVFEDATEYLGRNMSNGVRGASLNAIGSSMPELITSFIFLFFLTGSEGYAGTIGTTAGSAVFNTLLIPALVILAVFIFGMVNRREGVTLNPKVVRRDGIFLLIAEMALILVIASNTITWIDGAILLVIYVVYAVVLFRQSDDNPHKMRIIGSKKKRRSSWIKLTYSTLLMTGICWILVYSVEQIGHLLGVPLIFVSIILASAASSVPDTVISIKDGLKGNYDDAVSNALGSNIFDICVAHGLPLLLYILIYGPVVMSDETTTHSARTVATWGSWCKR
jgi:cation:H+ antiporter